MSGRKVSWVGHNLQRLIRFLRYTHQRTAVRLHIAIHPRLFKIKMYYRSNRSWIAGLILVGILSSCITCTISGMLLGGYEEGWSPDIAGKILSYLRRTGAIKAEEPDMPAFEPSKCMFGQSETWYDYDSPETAGFLCGYVSVPLFYSDPEKGQIKIPVAILPAENETPLNEPLFLAQGGPGGVSLDLYPSLMNYSNFERDRDLVMIDQRGTRYSDPALVCVEDDFPEPEDDSEDASDRSYLAGLRTCSARLNADVANLSAYTTQQMAGDTNAVRQALGYEKISFYGVSYGTHIGLYLMHMFPETLASVILDGVAPLPFDYINEDLYSDDRVLQQLFVSCESDPACSEAYPNLEERLTSLLEKADADPILLEFKDPASFAKYKKEFNGHDLLQMILGTFYYSRTYAILPFIVQEAEQGNFKYFEYIGGYSNFDRSFSNAVYLSVLCSEHEAFKVDWKTGKDARQWLRGYEEDNWRWYSEACGAWQVERNEGRLLASFRSEVPVLLLSGQFDPVTPPEYAEEARVQFTNDFHIIDPQGSHGVGFSDDCTRSIMSAFLANPELEPEHDCLENVDRHANVIPPDAIQLRFLMSSAAYDGTIEGLRVFFALLLGVISLRNLGLAAKGSLMVLRRRQRIAISEIRTLRMLHQIMIFAFVIFALFFTAAITNSIVEVYSNRAFLDVFALPGNVHTLIAMPFFMLLLSSEILLSGIMLWRRELLSRMEKNHFALFSLILVGFMGFLLHQGLVILPI